MKTGVEDVKTDCKSRTVVIKGKAADPANICERIQKKTGKKVELISPLPKPPEEEEKKEEAEAPPEETKEEVTTIVFSKYITHDLPSVKTSFLIRPSHGCSQSRSRSFSRSECTARGVLKCCRSASRRWTVSRSYQALITAVSCQIANSLDCS